MNKQNNQKNAKKLLARYHVDYPSGCKYRFVDFRIEKQILHYHDYFEIFLTLSDGIVHHINERVIHLGAGTLVFIRPNDLHCFSYENQEAYMVNLTFNMQTSRLLFSYLSDGFPAQKLLSQPFPPYVILSQREKEKLLGEMSELNSIAWEDKMLLKSRVRLLLANIFMNYFSSYYNDFSEEVPLWLFYTCEKMIKKDNFLCGIEKMTEISGKTYEHLSRSLKKYYKQTPTEFINDIRLNYVANMLINSTYSVTYIAYESGFSNISWFYTCFNKKYGISPLEFREKYK